MTIPVLALLRPNRFLLVALLLGCLCWQAQAQRKDVVVMSNGDHFTGKVKRLQNGLLFVETDYVTGNIGLDWNQVASIQSTATFHIVLNSGQRLMGKIEKISGEKANREDFLIHEAAEEVQVPSADVASMETKKPTFWRQLQGAIDLGYNFTSGNGQTTLGTDTSAAYKTKGWQVATSFDATFSGQSGASKTNREDGQVTFAKFLNRNSFVATLSDFLHSSQQDLNLRTTLGGGYGRYLIRTTTATLPGWAALCTFTSPSAPLRVIHRARVWRLWWDYNTTLFASTSESSILRYGHFLD